VRSFHKDCVRIAVGVAAALLAATAAAAPWLEVGDSTLRSDVDLLAARGLVDGPVTTWPLPAGQFATLMAQGGLSAQPLFVQDAAQRVIAHLRARGLQARADTRVATQAETIRRFETVARNDIDVRGGLQWSSESSGVALLVGDIAESGFDESKLSFDGSYATTEFWNARPYAGWVDQWFGPGSTSSLLLSSNARPFPKIGVMRDDPHAFKTPWLSWFGPWQADAFVGLLDGPRVDEDVVIAALRIGIRPIRSLEIGLTRMTQMCGTNHACKPVKAAFDFRNDDATTNEINEEAGVDLKYTGNIGSLTLAPYLQFMNEDNGPFTHSLTSHLFGTTLTGPFGDAGSYWTAGAEFTDSVATKDWLSFGERIHGSAYNNRTYVDGFRYRDRTLGFSLDSDSRLFTLSGGLVDSGGRSYRVTYDQSQIGSMELTQSSLVSPNRNVVSPVPLKLQQLEARASIPWRWFTFDLSVRGESRRVAGDRDNNVEAELGIRFIY
jgi:hypothetical protein